MLKILRITADPDTYRVMNYRDGEVRVVEVDGEKWYSLNDIHSCIRAWTESTKSVRRVNAKQELARKIWLYGVPNLGWFVGDGGESPVLRQPEGQEECSAEVGFRLWVELKMETPIKIIRWPQRLYVFLIEYKNLIRCTLWSTADLLS